MFAVENTISLDSFSIINRVTNINLGSFQVKKSEKPLDIKNIQTISPIALGNELLSFDEESELLRHAMGQDRLDVVDILIKYGSNCENEPAAVNAHKKKDMKAVSTLIEFAKVAKVKNSTLKDLQKSIQKSKHIEHLKDSELNHFKDDPHLILEDAKDNAYDFGVGYHGYGKALVKGDNLNFHTTQLEGKKVNELDFKINHAFRASLEDRIHGLQNTEQKDIQKVLKLGESHASQILVSEIPHALNLKDTVGNAYCIDFVGLGRVIIGSSEQNPTLYNKISVQIDETKNLDAIHEMLCLLGLEDALTKSTSDEIERIKIGQLFRTFFPTVATMFERTREFFELSLDKLKKKITEKAPEMNIIFKDYLPKMEAREIMPGRVRYCISGLAEKAYELGARGLTAAITGAWTDQDLFERCASMLKMGLLSTEMRYRAGITKKGMSPAADFYTGGADSVFTQLITQTNIDEKMPFYELNYYSKVRFMISLDALETGTYQYHYDSFGTRKIDDFHTTYLNRPALFDFVTDQCEDIFSGNEIMVKERIAPSYFEKIIVEDEETKSSLIDFLRKCNLIEEDSRGNFTLLGKQIDEFLQVSSLAL